MSAVEETKTQVRVPKAQAAEASPSIVTRALNLPTFSVEGMTLIKRLTLIVRDKRIEKVFYPVFPPDTHAEEVIGWLKAHPVKT